ncbi:MAG: polysaccharide deacetylase family protein [Treponema sp.]|nr:polysaccharide deacetylase family protein [Treponema sp.]
MGKKYCSLTFDDGPNHEGDDTMNRMLDILEKHGVKGSFFLIGNKITEKNTPVIERAMKMGCDIENHSWTHPNMTELSADQIREEYEKTDRAIIKITGKRPEFFRPPYIAVNQTMYDNIETPFICAHGCRDWEPEVSVEERLKLMMDGAVDRMMFLLHVDDGNEKTLQLVDKAIPILKEKGFEFATVPELFEMAGIEKKNNGQLWSCVKQ